MRSFADTWATLSVAVRRDVDGALVTSVRVPTGLDGGDPAALGEPVSVSFTKRGRVPMLPPE